MCINQYLQKGNDTGQKKSGNEYRCTDCELSAGTCPLKRFLIFIVAKIKIAVL